MHPELDALCRRHDVSPALRAELEALLVRPTVPDTMVFDDTGSVVLKPPPPPRGEAAAVERGATASRVAGAVARSVGASEGDAPGPSTDERYEDLGPLGAGGMGEVRRVRDRTLHRTLARKVVHTALLEHPLALERFLEEARATAQLQHPAILPVHDLGQLPDGRLWFTMKEVRGRTLGEAIRDLHAASPAHWGRPSSGWTLRRVVSAFHTVCRAVAYAHARGVVHRDLKPENTMLGDHGEVYVLDWGLAKILGRPDLAAAAGDLDVVRSGRSLAGATRLGQVAGTPAYMAPEQARGEVDRIDARSDVYALGAMLYEILAGHPPYRGDARAVLQQALDGSPPPLLPALPHPDGDARPDPGERGGPPLPSELVAACERAMARSPDDRHPSAEALAKAVEDWLDGSRRREEALAVVARAAEKAPAASAVRAHAAALRTEAETALSDVPGWHPEEAKAPAWAKEDEAAALERRAALLELEEEQLLHGSLTHAPELPEAHAALAARYRAEHAAAEGARRDATRPEALLRQHLAALPEPHPDRDALARYLEGDGALTLHTDPPGAEVLLHSYELHNRRLVPRFERSLGHTPLDGVSVPMGSYLCVLRHPERAEVRYPVHLARQQHWDGIAPGDRAPTPIRLPAPGELGPEDCYVPAGWCLLGGDTMARGSLPRLRCWVDGHVFRRFPVTNRAYLVFLDDLVARGRTEEALRHAPRERGGTVGELGAIIYGFDGTRFSLRPDADGDLWEPEWPVFMVDWSCAAAYAAWEAERSGLPWQLPGELAWEKAARGVDGRWYPWGDAFDPSWSCMKESHPQHRSPAPVDSFPVDTSPYGVRGMAGNACDWCADVFAPEGPALDGSRVLASVPSTEPGGVVSRALRGGGWYNDAPSGRSAARSNDVPGVRNSRQGFRIARPAG